ncbi:hypothetical protein PtA15_6A156 [Puccinia triticina]|uniref:Secreted protein n=1 Tax=Puccinia triticina TaxID=208348 RepID=A0ABY7CMG4_9BASI|nr:uncharacterized protein PtA15_6A156 [Puccinia triticina]WAQ85528.1 hypothetical protein PtA15_6A156 [Puccinia triticina]
MSVCAAPTVLARTSTFLSFAIVRVLLGAETDQCLMVGWFGTARFLPFFAARWSPFTWFLAEPPSRFLVSVPFFIFV